jgi:hypothetical protein
MHVADAAHFAADDAAAPIFEKKSLNGDPGMKCERCSRHKAVYRVYTDAIDLKVCFACAEEASRLGLPIEVLRVRD